MAIALPPKRRSALPLSIARWTARLASLASTGLIALFAFGPAERALPTPGEWLLLAFFPIGVVAGMLLAWWRELLGGCISVASLAIFYALLALRSGHIPASPWFLIFSLPAFVFLTRGLLSRTRAASA